MNAENSTGRNAPCPCGSGLKSKACCAKKAPPARQPRTSLYFVIGLVVLAAAVAFVLLRRDGSKSSDTAGTVPTSSVPSTLPAMPIAPVAGATEPSFAGLPAQPTPGTLLPQAPIAQGPLTPQPPGPVPDGKVWSPEHGHWHDVAGSAPQVTPLNMTQGSPAPALAPGPQPPGPVPDGKVWSAEHGHWHDVAPGAAAQP